MDRSYWHQQTLDKPLFPDLEWSQPQQRSKAGKLLIVGGYAHGFAAPGEAYGSATKAGAGSIRVILPGNLKKLVDKIFPAAEYAPSSASGGLNADALGDIVSAASWADCVLLAGDFGNNSETAILLEQFVGKYNGELVGGGDSIDCLKRTPELLTQRGQTTLVLNFAQAQKLFQYDHFPKALVSSTDLLHLVELIHDYSQARPKLNLMVVKDGIVLIASNGDVCTTKIIEEIQLNLTKRAAFGSVWLMQNPTKTFESLCVSVQKN